MNDCAIRAGLGLVLLLAAAVAARGEELRTWKDDTGKFEIRAQLDRIEGEQVFLKRADGKVLAVPKSRLSKADLEYLAAKKDSPPAAGDAPAGQKREPVDALVLVSVTVADKPVSTFPALSAFGDGKRTIVATADLPRDLREHIEGVEVGANRSAVVKTPDPVKFTISWGDEERPKQVEGQLIALYRRPSMLLLAAPAADLPPPLGDSPPPAVREADPVTVLALESQTGQRSSSYARSKFTGAVQKIFRNPQGQVTHLEVTLPERTRIVTGLVFTADGVPLGTIGPALPPQSPEDRSQQFRHPVALVPWKQRLAPQITLAWVHPVRGDRDKIDYEFVIDIADPFGEMRSPRLLVLPRSGDFVAVQSQLGRQLEVKRGLLEDSIQAKLLDEQPHEKFRRQFTKPPAAGVKTYVARMQTDNPWNDNGHRFFVQLVYELPDGSTRHLDPTLVSYELAAIRRSLREDPQAAKRGVELPAIPGFDGSSKDAPAATPHPGGGWLLTSDVTRLKAQPPRIDRAWPEPVRVEAPIKIAKSQGPEGAQAHTLELEVPRSELKFPTAWLVAPEGTHLFVVDDTHKMHRIRLADMTDELTWNLGVQCHSLGWAKAGLLVCAGEGSILVLNPTTLERVREIPGDRPQVVRGNPASDIGFALTLPSRSSLGNDGDTLSMLDLAKGEILHRIHTSYPAPGGSRTGLWVNKQLISFANWHLEMSSDGKWLFSTGATTCRFRLEGRDLVLDAFEEETTNQQLPSAFGNDFILSPDGKYIARRKASMSGGLPLVTIANTSQWKVPILEIPDTELAKIAFEPASNDVYVFGTYGRPQLRVYDLRTKEPRTYEDKRELSGLMIQVARGGKHAVLQEPTGKLTVAALAATK